MNRMGDKMRHFKKNKKMFLKVKQTKKISHGEGKERELKMECRLWQMNRAGLQVNRVTTLKGWERKEVASVTLETVFQVDTVRPKTKVTTQE